jgi:hypothetical protein
VKQFAIGTVISLINISIHAVWTIVLDRAVQRYWGEQVHERFTRDRFLLMICVGTALIVAHFIEVLVWVLFYDAANVAPPGIDPVYFALVHYTTIGHGDIAAPPMVHGRDLRGGADYDPRSPQVAPTRTCRAWSDAPVPGREQPGELPW